MLLSHLRTPQYSQSSLYLIPVIFLHHPQALPEDALDSQWHTSSSSFHVGGRQLSVNCRGRRKHGCNIIIIMFYCQSRNHTVLCLSRLVPIVFWQYNICPLSRRSIYYIRTPSYSAPCVFMVSYCTPYSGVECSLRVLQFRIVSQAHTRTFRIFTQKYLKIYSNVVRHQLNLLHMFSLGQVHKNYCSNADYTDLVVNLKNRSTFWFA